jgi:hypothetical protein
MLRNVLPFGTAALHKNDERKKWLLKEYARIVPDSRQIRFKLFRSILFSRARSRESRRSFSLSIAQEARANLTERHKLD